MNGKLARDLRKQAKQAGRLAVDAMTPAIKAALDHSAMTAQRVDEFDETLHALEAFVAELKLSPLPALSLKARLRWLLFGG